MKIKFHYSLLLLVLLSILTGFYLRIVYLVIILFMHELSHIITCLYYRREIRRLTFFSFGCVMEYSDNQNSKIIEDLLICSSGLILNIVISLIGINSSNPFFMINKYVLFFNLLPIWPLDGSRILVHLLSYFFSYKKSLKVALIISFIFLFISYILSTILLSVNYFIVLVYLTIENIMLLKTINQYFFSFILKKYLYPNDELKDFSLKPRSKNIITFFHKGVNNNIVFENKEVKEKDFLDSYFNG